MSLIHWVKIIKSLNLLYEVNRELVIKVCVICIDKVRVKREDLYMSIGVMND
jgi:hypothetical protein